MAPSGVMTPGCTAGAMPVAMQDSSHCLVSAVCSQGQGGRGLPPRRTGSVPEQQIYPHVGLPCALAKHSQPNLQDWCCH
jgi:hypothetical protein